MKSAKKIFLLLLVSSAMLLCGCGVAGPEVYQEPSVDLSTIPEFSGEPYVILNNNVPEFSEEDLSSESYEWYGPLDSLGRCTMTEASIGPDLMPTEERGSISHIRPSGWQMAKYDIVDGKYLYNRCHLIGFQLTGENDNERNLITGTRYMNVDGMLPFEDMVDDYIDETGNHVMYRVTPIFQGENLVASGVHMEAMSVEDNGEGIFFNVYVYNNQPGILIDYATGESYWGEDLPADNGNDGEVTTYVLNTNSHKFHLSSCSGVTSMNEENKETYTGSRSALIDRGYDPCGTCKP